MILHVYECSYLNVCMCIMCMLVAFGGQKRAVSSLRMSNIATMWMLGTELWVF